MNERETYLHYLTKTLVDPEREVGRPRRIARVVVPQRFRMPLRWASTIVMTPSARRRARAIASKGSAVKVHLGCGYLPKEGWINVDLVGAPVDVAWDVTKELPFASGSVDAVFHEHLLEHLPLAQGLALLDECHRVLREDGILRIGVPDGGAYLEAYCSGADRSFLWRNRPDRPTPLLGIQEVFFKYEHRAMYDFETLAFVCRAAGFSAVEHLSFGESRLQPCPDSVERQSETLYVEAYK